MSPYRASWNVQSRQSMQCSIHQSPLSSSSWSSSSAAAAATAAAYAEWQYRQLQTSAQLLCFRFHMLYAVLIHVHLCVLFSFIFSAIILDILCLVLWAASIDGRLPHLAACLYSNYCAVYYWCGVYLVINSISVSMTYSALHCPARGQAHGLSTQTRGQADENWPIARQHYDVTFYY